MTNLESCVGQSFLFTPEKTYKLIGFTVKSITEEFVKFNYLFDGSHGQMVTEFFLDHLKNKIFIPQN